MADTVLTELKIHEFDSVEQMSQYESEIGENDIVYTPDQSLKGTLFDYKWADHILNDISWLRAATFSWHGSDEYKAAYEHLANDINGKTLQSEIVGDITVQFYLADDEHKICPASQESNLVALYEATGTAWYYILDTDNQQFKLPRMKEQGIKEVYNGSDGIIILSNGLVIQNKPNRSGNTWTPNMSLVDTTRPVGASAASYGSAYAGERTMYFGTEWTGEKFVSHATSNGAGASGTLYGATLISYATDEQISAFLGRDFRSSFPDKHLYFYVGNFEQDAVEQTAGINAETFNRKADIDGGNCSEFFSKFSMPSGAYTNLTLGSSGTQYTAPADGWVAINKVSNGNSQWVSIASNNMGAQSDANSGGTGVCYLPVKSGDTFTVSYSLSGTTNFFRFVYAEGSKHLA